MSVNKMKNPIQPLVKDENGVLRFKENVLVCALLLHGQATGYGLNELARDFCLPGHIDDRQQLAQLLGYSLSGYADISYVSDDAYRAAATSEICGEAVQCFKERDQLRAESKVTERLLADRQKLLDAIPECELHGKCIPHALEWINKRKEAKESCANKLADGIDDYNAKVKKGIDALNKVQKSIFSQMVEFNKTPRGAYTLSRCLEQAKQYCPKDKQYYIRQHSDDWWEWVII